MLTHVQAYFILHELDSAERTTEFLNTTISRQGLSFAILYLFFVSVILLTISAFSRGLKQRVKKKNFYYTGNNFAINSIFLIVSGIGYFLVFVLVGGQAFLEESRPGLASGSSILLTILSIGTYPLLLCYIFQAKPRVTEYVSFGLVLIVTALFSRIHVVMYVFAGFIAWIYFKDGVLPIRVFTAIRAGFYCFLGVILFVVFGALRDALNYTDFDQIVSYLIENPEASLLSVSVNYKVSIEGMSGLASAATLYLDVPDNKYFLFGFDNLFYGIIQVLPSVVRKNIALLSDGGSVYNWHVLSVVPSGIEASFVSFHIAGAVVYPVLLFALSHYPIKILRKVNVGPEISLIAIYFLACLVFFVRGSPTHWLGFSLANAIVILLASVFLRTLVRRVRFGTS